MHTFNVDDKAIVISTYKNHMGYPRQVSIGDIVTIVSELELMRNPGSGRKAYVHRIDIKAPVDNWFIAFEPHKLKPYYDGNEVISWKDSVWKPNTLREEAES